jgi:hypothetical protein
VREEGVVLEDGIDRTVVRGQAGDVPARELDAAGVRLLEAGDHPERGRLPRPRRAEQGEELSALHLEVDRGDRDHVAVALADPDQADVDLLGARCRTGLAVTPPCLSRGYRRLLVWLESAGRMSAPYNAARCGS